MLNLKKCPCGQRWISLLQDHGTQAIYCPECAPSVSHATLVVEKMQRFYMQEGSLEGYPLEERLKNLKGDWTPHFQNVQIDLGGCRLSYNGPKLEMSGRLLGARVRTLIEFGNRYCFLFVDSPSFKISQE